MNLYLRMLFVYLQSKFKDRIAVDNLQNRLTLRVLPNDLDLNMHMNNGRYLTICDLSRLDLFIRTGLARLMLRNKWMPIISRHDMTYIKPLRLFQKYQVEMEIVRWDEKYFYAKHTFTSNGKTVAEGTSRAVVRAKEGVLSPETIIKEVKAYQQETA